MIFLIAMLTDINLSICYKYSIPQHLIYFLPRINHKKQETVKHTWQLLLIEWLGAKFHQAASRGR